MVEAVMRSDYRAQSETSLSLGEGETFHIMQMQVRQGEGGAEGASSWRLDGILLADVMSYVMSF